MSKAAKQSILILIFLIIGCLGFIFFIMLDKQKVVKVKVELEKEVASHQKRETQYLEEGADLKEKIKKVEEAKAKIQKELEGIDADIKSLNKQVKNLKIDRDDWKGRVKKLQEERQKLLVKLEEKPEPKTIIKYIVKEPEKKEEPETPSISLEGLGDSYWAGVLKEKAGLELEVEYLNSELSETLIGLEELKKSNSDLDLELGDLKKERDSIEREIKYGKDLSDTLSLELARAKSDRKFMQDQFEKINEDNDGLRNQIRQLTSTKIALEKSIVKISEEKRDIEKKLIGTEGLIEDKIQEIWKIKESLSKTTKSSPAGTVKEIELPPIIVSAHGPAPAIAPAPMIGISDAAPGINGNVVNVNENNNFVIVDLGQNDGISIGDKLAVYRQADYIAEVEVIQVRADICAADIKLMTSNIKVGDNVR